MARFRHNMTLKDVAVKSGMSATHISEIERGKTSPTIGCLQKIAAALDERPCLLRGRVELVARAAHRRSDRPKEYRCGAGRKGGCAETVAGGVPWGNLHVAHAVGRPGRGAHPTARVTGEVVIMCVSGMLRVTVGDDSACPSRG